MPWYYLRKEATGGGQVRAIDWTRSDWLEFVFTEFTSAAESSTMSLSTSEAWSTLELISEACLFVIPNSDVPSKFWGRGLTHSSGRKRKLMPMEERPIMVDSLDHSEGKMEKAPRSARCTKLIWSSRWKTGSGRRPALDAGESEPGSRDFCRCLSSRKLHCTTYLPWCSTASVQAA